MEGSAEPVTLIGSGHEKRRNRSQKRGGPDSAAGPAIASALMAALLVHACSKCAVALASGGWRYALAVAPGIVAHTLAFVGVFALQ